jgi:hypothetical protein
MDRPAFTPTRTEEEREAADSINVTVRIPKSDLEWLRAAGIQMRQEKITTTIKTLARLGYIALQEPKTVYLAETVFKNERNNQRLGIREIDPKWGST